MHWKNYYLLLIIFLVIPNISALCEEGQIDVNTASLEELDTLYGIGPVKAQAIIETRPFETIDDLINVKGIGEITLEKIKEQGLACTGKEKEQTEDPPETSPETPPENPPENPLPSEEDFGSPIVENVTIESEVNSSLPERNISKKQINPIILNPQIIKSAKDNKKTNKDDYAKYGLILFGILITLLFLLKRKTTKNEFRN